MPKKFLNIISEKLDNNKILNGVFLAECGYFTELKNTKEVFKLEHELRLYYVSTGDATMIMDDKEYYLAQHDLFFQPKNKNAFFKSNANKATEIWWLDCYGSGIITLKELLNININNPIISGLHDSRFLLELNNIFNYQDNSSNADPLHITSSLYKILALVIETSQTYEWSIINYDNPEILYTGDWKVWPSPFSSKQEEYYTGTPKSYVEYNFFGTGIKWIGTVNFDCGKADVIIDGNYQTTIDTYSPVRLSKQLLYINTKLKNDYHIIKIFCTGEKNDKATNCDVVLESFHYLSHNDTNLNGNYTNNSKLTQQAINLINQNIQDINVNKLSENLGVSRSYLTTKFSNDLGLSPSQYLIKTRIDKAKHLLVNTNIPISDIAIDIGYSDVFYFSKLFKNRENISPSKFRNIHQIKDN